MMEERLAILKGEKFKDRRRKRVATMLMFKNNELKHQELDENLLLMRG